MVVRVYTNRLRDVVNYCNDNNKHPVFLNKIIKLTGSETIICNYLDIDLSILEQICKWCENEDICDKLDKYDDFYHKFKRIINDTKSEERNMFDLN